MTVRGVDVSSTALYHVTYRASGRTRLSPLKVLGVAVLGFFLFVSLSVFGLAFTINSTLLNRSFLPNQLDRLDVAALAEEVLDDATAELPAEVRDSVVRAVARLEPQAKARIRAATARLYDYLLGRTDDISLAAVLKETVLDDDFIASVASDPEILSLVRKDLRDQLADLVPAGQRQLVRYLDEALPSIDPWLKQQVHDAAGPAVDYLLGESTTIRIVVPLDAAKATLRVSLRDAFMRSPPPELAGASQAELDSVFNQYYDRFAAQVPATAVIDPASLGVDAGVSLAPALAEAESALAEARKAVGLFRLYYVLLIVFILLLVAAVILIHRHVRRAARDLGIILLVSGALQLAGVLSAVFLLRQIDVSQLPRALQPWVPGLYADFFRPWEVFSLTLAIMGLAILVVSLVYPRRADRRAATSVGTDDQS